MFKIPLKRPRLVRVCENSMLPTYKDGDILFVLPVRFSKIKEGDVLIFYRKEAERVLIKRVTIKSNHTKKLFFEGDNPEVSHDSRHFGFVDAECVLGKVYPQRKKGECESE